MYELKRKNFEAYVTIPHAFAPHEIVALRALIENQEKTVGTISGTYTDKQIRDSRVRWIQSYDTSAGWIFDRVTSIVNDANLYFGLDLTATEAIQLTEYDAEYHGFYGSHIDAVYGNEASTARGRKLSITMQLSDPAEYEGGELKLYPHNLTGIVADKRVGSMTLFRSHIVHEVTPVTKGKRLSFVTWVQGPLIR